MSMDPTTIEQAVAALRNADGLLITAGAGIGVDSGLPDFRGSAGFWRAYPALARARLHFQDIATPNSFTKTPHLAWGFYGHRLNLYRRTVPHAGFDLLRQLARRRFPPRRRRGALRAAVGVSCLPALRRTGAAEHPDVR